MKRTAERQPADPLIFSAVRFTEFVSVPGGPSDKSLGYFQPSAKRGLVGGLHMRSDIVPGAIFPDYELSDHTAKRRKLSELQGQDPMVLVLSRGGSVPKTAGKLKGWFNSIVSSRLAIAAWSQSAPTTSLRRMNIAVESMPTGLSSPTRGVWSKRISTLPNTLILSTIR